jgi:hypothetical protein
MKLDRKAMRCFGGGWESTAEQWLFTLRLLQKERGRLAREFKTKHHADEPSALQSLTAFCRGLTL